MKFLKPIFFTLKKIFSSPKSYQDLDDEIRFHMEMSIEAKMDEGMSRRQAEREARKAFGGELYTKESCQMNWGMRFIEETISDFRYAIKRLWKNKSYSIPIILVLASALSICVLHFTNLYYLFNPFPFPDSKNIIQISTSSRLRGYENYYGAVRHDVFVELQKLNDTFENIAFHTGKSYYLYHKSTVEHTHVGIVNPSYWSIIKIKCKHGRFHSQEDLLNKNNNMVVVSDRFAREHFGRSIDAVGENIRLDDQYFDIIGVYRLKDLPYSTQIFMAFESRSINQRINSGQVYCRLKNNVSRKDLDTRLDSLMTRLKNSDHPSAKNNKKSNRVFKTKLLNEPSSVEQKWDQRSMSFAISFLGIAIYFLACSNSLGIFQTNLVKRKHELSTRFALGGNQIRVFKMLMIETLVLNLLACLFALAIAWLIQKYTASRKYDIHGVFGILGITSINILFCAGYVWKKHCNKPWQQLMEDRSGTKSTKSSTFVVSIFSQILICTVLLVLAFFLTINISKLIDVDFGFDYRERIIANIRFPKWKYNDDSKKTTDAIRRISEDLKYLPEISSLTVTDNPPQTYFSRGWRSYSIPPKSIGVDLSSIDNSKALRPSMLGLSFNASDLNFLETLDVKLLDGRWFNETDKLTEEVELVVSEQFASTLFKNREVVGYSFSNKVNGRKKPVTHFKIIGVVNDVNYKQNHGINFTKYRGYYLVYEKKGPSRNELSLIARTKKLDAESMLKIQKRIQKIAPDVSIEVSSYKSEINGYYGLIIRPKKQTLVLAITTFLITAFGLFSFFYYTSSLKQKEHAIRICLGGKIEKLAFRYICINLIPVSLALLSGGIISIFLLKTNGHQLSEISFKDPFPYLAVIAMVLLVFTCASVFSIQQIKKISLKESLSME